MPHAFINLLPYGLLVQVYIYISYRLFLLTNTLKVAAIPGRDSFKVGVNFAVMAFVASILLAVSYCVAPFVSGPPPLPITVASFES